MSRRPLTRQSQRSVPVAYSPARMHKPMLSSDRSVLFMAREVHSRLQQTRQVATTDTTFATSLLYCFKSEERTLSESKCEMLSQCSCSFRKQFAIHQLCLFKGTFCRSSSLHLTTGYLYQAQQLIRQGPEPNLDMPVLTDCEATLQCFCDMVVESGAAVDMARAIANETPI